ncbi:MAG: phosphate transport system regulatory protein PhoU [Actinobacteria bacterium]|nr:MAG: phosphate transport system regulatory protein PhoU [Actinomycetota bacterium]
MKRPLDSELKSLKNSLVKMGELVQECLAKSMEALVKHNKRLAKEVIEEDIKINKLEIKNENKCLKLLALYQPAAIDLRFISMAIKINNDLERMADLAVNIAERAIDLKEVVLEQPLQKITEMADITSKMVKGSVDSFVNKNAELAKEISDTDDEVDRLNEEIFSELLTEISNKCPLTTQVVGLLFISKYIERIADHADNICEDVIYIVKGKSPKFH